VNWEKSKSLSSLQRDFLLKFFSERRDFFLTGGAALSVFYLDHRLSNDLDLFTIKPVDWFMIQKYLEWIFKEIKANSKEIVKEPLFQRYQLNRGGENLIVDFVIDQIPQIDEKKNHFGIIVVDTLLEIAVNKICTLLSRAETKDIIDLFFLQKEGFPIMENLSHAKKKDAGFDPATLSFILSQIKVYEIPDFMIRKISREELQEFIESLQIKLADISFPENNLPQ
jgi:predicted nucleotidyltransferase component of viral defense system